MDRTQVDDLCTLDRHDVAEYYVYDPDTNALSGWEKLDDYLTEIPVMQDWNSPRLGIKFDLSTPPELQIYRPDGEIFLTFEQVSQRLETITRNLSEAEQSLAIAATRNQQLTAKLRELGIDPDTV